MIWLAAAILALTVLMGLETLIGGARIRRLRDCSPVDRLHAPPVSIVVAARDEAAHIEAAVATMLRQDYPDFELVVVDDRSTDDTSGILDRMATADPRLTVIHVCDLPPGWLGKNHALQAGAGQARGTYLLFADADVHLATDALSRAIGRCEAAGIDHLAVGPDLVMPGALLQAFGVFFLYSFLAFTKPWKASDPNSWFFVGIGAFNLVRREAYWDVGGHERVRLRPDDDLKLGKVLKRAGYRQEAGIGSGMLSVAWYHSLGEMIHGLEKNMFAGVDYSILLSLAGGLLQLVLGVLPIIAVFAVTGPVRVLLAAQVAAVILTMAVNAKVLGLPVRVVLLTPIVVGLFVFILWRTMVLNLIQGGIRWRGTFYSLRELKANRV